MRMCDVGWVWEGQGLDPGVNPSIFGVGEGCEYFGLTRANFLFHPTDDLSLTKLSFLDEVTCDISKWKFKDSPAGGAEHWIDAAPESVRREAEHVSRMSLRYPNVTGGFHDDMRGLIKRENCTADQYSLVYEALKSANPALKLWSVVYTHELTPEEWEGFHPFMDIINLWVWNAENLPKLDEYIPLCRDLFGDKPIILGCYLRDYPTVAPVPMDLLKCQWETLLRHLEAGSLQGFSILGAVLIDGQQEQANWVRDLIAANS
jgi:hypothetical protein